VVAQTIDLGAENLARIARAAQREREYAMRVDDAKRREAIQFHDEAAAETGACECRSRFAGSCTGSRQGHRMCMERPYSRSTV
jgi:hypothetical protein